MLLVQHKAETDERIVETIVHGFDVLAGTYKLCLFVLANKPWAKTMLGSTSEVEYLMARGVHEEHALEALREHIAIGHVLLALFQFGPP